MMMIMMMTKTMLELLVMGKVHSIYSIHTFPSHPSIRFHIYCNAFQNFQSTRACITYIEPSAMEYHGVRWNPIHSQLNSQKSAQGFFLFCFSSACIIIIPPPSLYAFYSLSLSLSPCSLSLSHCFWLCLPIFFHFIFLQWCILHVD